MASDEQIEFSDLPDEDTVDVGGTSTWRDAVVHATDWTTETLVSQLRRENIQMNPRFQRRDAWKIAHKSRFVESLILGLPIPQVVLAEVKGKRGKFIVLDGKQRLLSLLQFWGLGTGPNNGYRLSGLDVLGHLKRKTLSDLETDSAFEEEYDSLLNKTVRTVVIKNWPDVDFLHLVFLRLNTGSLKLSPQELRQAMFAGPYTDWVDDAASSSIGIKDLLNLVEPDSRMRDIELLARFVSFSMFLEDYGGRMKGFLDQSFERLNGAWEKHKPEAEAKARDFEAAVSTLTTVFGDRLARKPRSRHLNKAVLDFLLFYASDPAIRTKMEANAADVRAAYEGLFADADFRAAVERDTAGLPNTATRLTKWGTALGSAVGAALPLPSLVDDNGKSKITFAGF